ncbi:nuclear factor 7, brain-like [Heteronotia binoei]|uniref:nuclear factor 7, brain-like n=1 Tax=Heteronotia binoei TaxID=13085 RepID=UPI00292EEEF8|nr:nuclear factor 7, brain-like [Heteronotia binoei]
MASIREVSSIAEDLLCSVCLSIFQEPRMLGCGHNFCLTCLESCVVPKGQHQGTCPECRCPFRLQDAMCNRVLANLAEKARLLKLEEGAQSDGSWYFCEEHEEPLKLFCSEDEAPVCVICRDLPQHQGHRFLPIKNAVKDCQDKLKASLESLEDGMKRATNNKSCQQEAIEELESLSQHLNGHIFIEFENLRRILDTKEQSMMDTVKLLKEDNKAKMEEKLEYLKHYESSHAETISMIQAALEESNEFALLKVSPPQSAHQCYSCLHSQSCFIGFLDLPPYAPWANLQNGVWPHFSPGIKKLMQRIQDRLEEGNGEAEMKCVLMTMEPRKHDDAEDETTGVNVPERKGNETKNYEGEPYEEAQDVEEDQEAEDRSIISVDPALQELEEWLDFETWKEMLESIAIGEIDNQDSLYWYPSLEEDTFPPGDDSTSEATEEETTSLDEDLICAVEVTSEPDEVASDKPSPSSCSDTALPIERVLYNQPPGLCTPNYFPVPVFQQMPLYNSVQRWLEITQDRHIESKRC